MKRLLQNDESFPHCLTILHDFVLIICSENVLLLHEFILAFITRQAYNLFLYGKKEMLTCQRLLTLQYMSCNAQRICYSVTKQYKEISV